MDNTSSVLPTSCWKGAFPAPTEFQVTEPKHPLAALGMGLAAATDASRTLLLVNKFHYHWKKIQLVQSTLRSMQRRKDSCERATLSSAVALSQMSRLFKAVFITCSTPTCRSSSRVPLQPRNYKQHSLAMVRIASTQEELLHFYQLSELAASSISLNSFDNRLLLT